LKLKIDILLSTSAFKFDLRRYKQVLIQVMMMQQHFLSLSKQQDLQLEALGGKLLEQQRVVAAAAAAAADQAGRLNPDPKP